MQLQDQDAHSGLLHLLRPVLHSLNLVPDVNKLSHELPTLPGQGPPPFQGHVCYNPFHSSSCSSAQEENTTSKLHTQTRHAHLTNTHTRRRGGACSIQLAWGCKQHKRCHILLTEQQEQAETAGHTCSPGYLPRSHSWLAHSKTNHPLLTHTHTQEMDDERTQGAAQQQQLLTQRCVGNHTTSLTRLWFVCVCVIAKTSPACNTLRRAQPVLG